MQKQGSDRRSFIRSTTAAGAALALAPKVFGATAGSQGANEINVALLGAGVQGQLLADTCLKMGTNPGVRFRAVCDIWEAYNQDRASQLLKRRGHDHSTYVDYGEMLDKERDLDAVIVATPDSWHAEHTAACLKAGLHVYCEAPMANTIEGAKQMVRTARETGKLLQIGHQRRSNPRYIHCFEGLIKEIGLLGRITTAYGQWNRSAQADLGWPKRFVLDETTLNKYGYKSMYQFKNWRWYKGLGGGPVVELGTHQIDVFNWFLEALPSSVTARGGTYYFDKDTHEWYDTVMAILEYESSQGIVAVNYQVVTANGFGGYYELIMGDQGTLEISESPGRGMIYRELARASAWDKWVKLGYLEEPTQQQEEKPVPEGVVRVKESKVPPSYILPVKLNDPYHKPHLENFFKAVRGEATLNCPAETAYLTTATVLKVNDAVEAARPLGFDPDELVI